MDTTPDISHNEQLTILIRIVNMDEKDTKSVLVINEYFLDFINVKSTTRLDLSEILISQLKIYNIDLKDCRGQTYDNGSNMVGQYKGVQSRVSNINSRAFFTPCTDHSLNLVLCDAAKNSLRAVTFFGLLRLYNLFSASVGRWDILKNNCKQFTVKQWYETRWESRLISVKALSFQIPFIMNALEEVSNDTNKFGSKK